MDLKKISKLTEMLSACRELEEVAGGLYENLQDAQRQELHNSTKKAAEEARKQRAKVAKEFPPAQRARCTAQSRLQVTLDELNETLMSNAQQEKLGVIVFFSFMFFCLSLGIQFLKVSSTFREIPFVVPVLGDGLNIKVCGLWYTNFEP